MSADVFSGILAGLAESHAQHNQQLMQLELQRRSALAGFWQKQYDDPNVRPEAKDIAAQKFLGIVQSDPMKKLPKHLEAMDDFLTVSPQLGRTVERQNPVAPPGAPPM